MTHAGRRILLGVLTLGSFILLIGFIWPAPRLGPAHPPWRCAAAEEEINGAIRCGAATGNLRPGDRLTSSGQPGRMNPARLELLEVPLDPNQSSASELESLPGIGPALARRMIEGRPYRAITDLADLPGIGPRRLAALKPRIVFFR